MCGISGIYNFEHGEPADQHLLNGMLDLIRHRGPDDEGIHVDGDVVIGMCRLSIIDLDRGHQPIYNEDRSVAVVFNGEIYNYRELRSTLEQRGHRFSTNSDTEVIVHLYEDAGEDCVQQLRGMFSFAVWDSRRRRLFIARDRLGIKPLYYTLVAGKLIFGSEIKSILHHPEVRAPLDVTALSDFLSLKYVPAPRTLFDGVAVLPPGHHLTCDRDGVTIQQYWDMSFAGASQPEESEEAYAERLEELLKESVRLRLRADVPFGAFLSGGVDSSTIVALMSHYLEEPVKTFSIGFQSNRHNFDELPYARMVAQQYNTDHHEIIMGAEDLPRLAEKVTWHLDQPIADQAMLATYMVSELASRHVKMVLTGEGGDELFAGYARYVGERLSPFFRMTPWPAKSLALALSRRLPGFERPKIALNALCHNDEATRFSNWFPLFNNDTKALVLSEATRGHANDAVTADLFRQHLSRTDATHPLNRMLYVDTKLWLSDFLLARGDKMTMANSLEARVPLLDHKLVEFAASLPPRFKLKGMARKYLLKKVARKFLPRTIIDRKKQGFPIPVSAWLRNESRTFMRDILSPHAIRERGLFDVDYVATLLQQHDTGVADHGLCLWGLLSVELWHQLYIDSRPTPQTTPKTPTAKASAATN